jgi:hypothetical protein
MSLSAVSPVVTVTSVTHTFYADLSIPGLNINSNNYMVIKYPKENHRMSLTCTEISGGLCMTFIESRMIVFTITNTVSGKYASFSISGVNNGWYR